MDAVRQSDSWPTCAKPILITSPSAASAASAASEASAASLSAAVSASVASAAVVLLLSAASSLPQPASKVAPIAMHISTLTNFFFILKTSQSFY